MTIPNFHGHTENSVIDPHTEPITEKKTMKEDKNNKDTRANNKERITALSAGLAIPVVKNESKEVRKALGKSMDKGFDGLEKEAGSLNRKLIHGLKRKGIKIVTKEGNNAGVISQVNQESRDFIAGALKNLPDEKRKSLANAISESVPLGAIGRKAIIVGKDVPETSKAATLAHELGHLHYQTKLKAGKIGKAAHKAYGASRIAISLTPVYGYASGVKNARKEDRGEKLTTWDKTKSIAVPLALSAPILVAEGAASARGIKILKEAGASKKYLKASKKSLAKAHGTYTISAATKAATGGLSELLGRRIEEEKLQKKKN